jgi:Tol biopolymer transport system component
MADQRRPAEPQPPPHSSHDRLSSWKEIAEYLRTSVRTVQRWEKSEALPTHRHLHDKRGSVYAYKPEVDRWYEGRRERLQSSNQPELLRAWRTPFSLAFIVLAAGCLGAALSYVLVVRTASPAPLSRLSVLPPSGSTFVDGIESGGQSISPDGTHLAFVAATEGQSSLWIRSLSSLEAHRLPGSRGAYYPFWSPDSRSVAFFAEGKLKRLDIAGGATQVLCDAVDGRGGSWGTNGVIVFAVFPSLGTAGLYRVAAAGGLPTRLTVVDASKGEVNHEWPAFLPDGRFLYYVRSQQQNDNGIYVGSLERDSRRSRVIGTRSNAVYARSIHGPGFLLWMRDGALLAQRFDLRGLRLEGTPATVVEHLGIDPIFGRAHVSAADNGMISYDERGQDITQLTWLDRSGRVLGTLGVPGLHHSPRISRDGGYALISRVDPESGATDIWSINLSTNAAVRQTTLPSGRAYQGPVWSPDGTEIAFGNKLGFFRKNLNSDRLMPLLPPGKFGFPDDWSRDGRFLLYRLLSEDTQYDVWLLPLTSGSPQPVPLIQTRFNDDEGQFSPNGRWIAYSSDESGRREVYVKELRRPTEGDPAPARRWIVSRGGGAFPRWRGDGKELFYRDESGRVTSVQLARGTEFVITSSPEPFFTVPLSRFPTHYMYDAAADGRRFLVLASTGQPEAMPIVIVSNWQAVAQ